jgi:uncharacterized protein YqkB
LYFTSGHKPHEYAAYYCLGGLHRNDGFYTWSNGESASFEFDLTEPVNEPLTISVVLYDVAMDWDSPNPETTVNCDVNGVDCGSVILTKGKKYLRFTIPAECYTDKLLVSFRYSHLHPSEGFNLAVAFEQMYISRAGQRFIEDAMSGEIADLSNKTLELQAHNTELQAHNTELEAHIARLESLNAQQKVQVLGLEEQKSEQSAQILGLVAQNTKQSMLCRKGQKSTRRMRLRSLHRYRHIQHLYKWMLLSKS